jgi:hypothetical protein
MVSPISVIQVWGERAATGEGLLPQGWKVNDCIAPLQEVRSGTGLIDEET